MNLLQKQLLIGEKYDTMVTDINGKRTTAMLLDFSVSNYKSIKEPIYFSAIATDDDTAEERLYHFRDLRVLPAAVIYGANGSGKSNFLNAINVVRQFVLDSIHISPEDVLSQHRHKLSGDDSESIYKIQFVKDNIRFAFGFTLKNSQVVEEYLYYFPDERAEQIFERDGESFTVGAPFEGRLDACKEVLKPNRLLLSCAANFSNVEPIAQAYNFFVNDIVIYHSSRHNDWMQYSLKQIHTNPEIKKAALAFLNAFQPGIKDIKTATREDHFPSEATLAAVFQDEFRARWAARRSEFLEATLVYDMFETDLLREESIGVRRLFEMLCPIIDVLHNGKILICDELEMSLHEALVRELADMFEKNEQKNFAQLIFTTHDTSLLDLSLFRRDQIWFTELMPETRATDLYSLVEFKDVRKDENIKIGYILGKYGAIPMLNAGLTKAVL